MTSVLWAVPTFIAVFVWIHSAGHRRAFPQRPQAIAAVTWSALAGVHLLVLGSPGVTGALWLFANGALLWEWSRLDDHRCPQCAGWGELTASASSAIRVLRCTACGVVTES